MRIEKTACLQIRIPQSEIRNVRTLSPGPFAEAPPFKTNFQTLRAQPPMRLIVRAGCSKKVLLM